MLPVATASDERRRQLRKQLVSLPGGRFLMGSEEPDVNPGDGEGPVREIEVKAFRVSPVSVTNAQFAAFVKSTGYITEAERFGWSFVFHMFVSSRLRRTVTQVPQATPWWLPIAGAFWRAPEGPGSAVADRPNHPVVHVSWNDAQAYCSWSGTGLPTEQEWEYAARGGLEQARYPWGNDLTPRGRYRCNIWQGTFPHHNTAADGYIGTAPVKTFQPNGYGLYQMVGNVWEWCADDFTEPGSAPDARAMRGGSYLCHESYCNRYRVAARTSNTPDSSAGNIGFRVVSRESPHGL
ncbi:formylglycine-generating enzyme family protein [Streptomyces sp. JH14]|uniref:formylglycine-generating enzyme family protein n=1 Tax=Streptomyces sp. JH14 TaxID=2793630 RepID=UPI0023F6FF1C|nr:formylglycine-generating enzyme family protein [Streptomyces sp. JH14]MDF6045980.1 formylglycine-generating enzyme family protein [Streptomyces sp. JH14]